jgi:RHS repeat-associated protein
MGSADGQGRTSAFFYQKHLADHSKRLELAMPALSLSAALSGLRGNKARIISALSNFVRRSVALLLVYSTIAATMPVRADQRRAVAPSTKEFSSSDRAKTSWSDRAMRVESHAITHGVGSGTPTLPISVEMKRPKLPATPVVALPLGSNPSQAVVSYKSAAKSNIAEDSAVYPDIFASNPGLPGLLRNLTDLSSFSVPYMMATASPEPSIIPSLRSGFAKVYASTAGGTIGAFGPQRYDRTTGSPNEYSTAFSLPIGALSPFQLNIQNGDPSGTNRVSSGSVSINGTQVVGPSDFYQGVATIARSVTLNSQNTLQITLASDPGSYIIINIGGTNPAPTANAGPNQTVFAGRTVQLNGVGSNDPSGLPLSYSWTLTSRPSGSTAVVSGANTATPTLVADKAGTYTAQLVVNNGYTSSSPSTITITAQNSTPIANAGPPQTVYVGSSIQLDGSGSSDPAGLQLSYSWSMLSEPSGSAALLSSSASSKPTFTADKVGTYKFQLVVNNGYLNSAPSTVVVTSQNLPPVANAGPPQTEYEDATVQLNGTGSNDPAGLSITYQWSFVSVPSGSNATLSDATTPMPTFVADKPGSFVIQLVVNNGVFSSTPSSVTISTLKSPPVANAGPNQSVSVHSTVQLDGSGSTDVDGSPLTYSWSLVSLPSGSNAVLSDQKIINPTFVADVRGNYIVQLIVNNGFSNSTPSIVTVSTINSLPVANGGANQSITVTGVVQLDGSGSTDVDGDSLTYSWGFLTVPAGSQATLSNANSVKPTFVADVLGTYILQLIVNDGIVNSTPATVMITSGDIPPTANPGPAQSVNLGSIVNLNGSASTDSDNQPLTYQWALLSKPTNSTAALSQSTSATPYFAADVAGNYIIQLIVNDGFLTSTPATVTISTVNTPPIANPGPNQTVNEGATVQLSGAASKDPDGESLMYKWAILAQPAGGTATLSSATIVNPTFLANRPGIYVVQLIVNDGTYDSQPATVTITANAVNQPPVVNAGPNQTITLPVNSVTLAGSATDDGLPNGTLATSWRVVSGPGTVTFNSPQTAMTDATFSSAGVYVLELTATDSQLSTSAQTTITINRQTTLAPVVDAGSNETVPYPNTFTLQGSVTSANTPPGKATALWSEVSGPPVVFANPSSPSTTVQFNSAGTYVLELTGTESGLSSSAPLTIMAVAGNQPPVVNAGHNSTITLPSNSVTLNGSATDDGLPSGTLALTWMQLTGPTGVTFSAPNQGVTQATFPGVGTYVLQLMADDSQLQGTSDVTVVVQPQPGNQAPAVNAGFDQSINLPGNLVTLKGSATDDGLPNGTLVTIWSQVGGPLPAAIVNPSAVSTQVKFTQTGTYVFQLTASDTQLSSSSTVKVMVNPASAAGTIRISPDSAGPDVVSTLQMVTAVLVDGSGGPVSGAPVVFNVTGANSSTGRTTTDGTGTATFNYQGTASGTDTIQAQTELAGSLLQSNAGSVSWIAPKQPVSISQVIGKFYPAPNSGATWDALATETPVFTQIFSNLTFNSDPSYPIGPIIPGGTGGVNYNTRPLTDVDLDGSGNFIGTTPAQENADVGPGLGSLFAFQAVFTGQLTVAQAGNLSFNINSDDSFQFGVGSGAVRVGGYYFQAVASGHSLVNDYPLMAAGGGGFAYPRNFTIYFPAPGTYPFEADYYECCGGGLAFILSSATTNPSPLGPTGYLTLTPQTPPSIAAGNAENLNVLATDGMGLPVSSVPVVLTVTGANPQQLAATTDLQGNARFAWTGVKTGTDVAQAQAHISGPMLTSNEVNVIWSGASVPPVVYAGPSQTITLPLNTVTLNGTASEPGNPNAGLSFTWAKVGGPGAVTFSAPNQLSTQAIFGSAGTYTLQLSATNAQLTSTSTVIVTVATPSLQPPFVIANPGQLPTSIALPQSSIVLSGEASDTYGHALVTTWSVVGGLGNVSFSAPDALYTIATFPATGAYILRLTAVDLQTQLSASSDVVVTVNSEQNHAPLVSAGLNQTITTTSLTLAGTVSDDGSPSNTLLTNWSMVSGPAQVVFSNPANPVSNVSFSTDGVYVLQLMADDTQLTASANVTITVNTSGGTLVNQAPLVSAGPSQTIRLPQNSVTLSGSATDDGLPLGSTLTTQWALLSGPTLPVPQNGYTAGRGITINHAMVPNMDQADFPVLITGTYGFLASVGNNGAVQNANGWDIIFTADSAGQQRLDHEIDSYDPVHGTVAFWVRIPLLSHTADTTIYIWYGNSAVANTQENKAGVWRNGYTGVWHFANNGPGLNISDSTGNFTNNTNQGATAAPGTIGGAASFNSSSPNQLLFPSASTLSGNFTIEAWLQPTGSDTPSTMGLLGSRSTQADQSFDIHLTSTGIQSDIGNGSSWLTNAASGTYNYSMNTWHHLAFVVSPNAYSAYENGASVGRGSFSGVPLLYDANHTFRIGATGWPGEYFNGEMDEVRLSSLVRSADWLASEYNNESEPALFYSMGGVTFSDPAQPVAQATFPVAGTYVLQLSASDTQLTSTATTTVVVDPAPTNNNPPSISITANKNSIALPDNTVTLTGTVNTNGASSAALAWSEVSGPSVVTFSSPTQATTQVILNAPGTYVFALVASTAGGSATAQITMPVTGQLPSAPTTAIIAPTDGGSITQRTAVMGSVSLSGGSWTLAYSPNDSSGNASNWTTFAIGSSSVQSGSLGTFDPTLLLNGAYTVRLQANDGFGQSSTTIIGVSVERNMKLGNFSLSFNDLSVPMPGLPIQITRTYDSRNKSQGDFGIGWTLSIANVRLQVSHNLAQNWSEDAQWSGLLPQYCLIKQDNSFVTATFPDGRVYKFQPVSNPQCQNAGPITAPTLGFVQVPTGSNTAGASLVPADGGSVLIDGDVPGPETLIDYNGNFYNPTQFILTTADGFTYTIDRTLGATRVKDPNGNTLTINPGGVTSSDGKSVAFLRDSQGRITQIQDPAGNPLAYKYDSSGNLSNFTDRTNSVTSFGYDSNNAHYLVSISDPRGTSTPAIKNVYDSSGRLLSTTDENGQTISYTPNLSANNEQIKDRNGNVTTYGYDDDGNITSITTAAGTTTYTYDSNDNKLTELLPGHTNATVYTYDQLGNRLTDTDPLGNKTTYTYNSLKQVTSITDSNTGAHQGTTINNYDTKGNLLSTLDAEGHNMVYTYFPNGQVKTMSVDGVQQASYLYDSVGNLTTQTDALGNSTTYTYDANGDKLTQTATRTKADGTQETLVTQYQYNGNGRLTKTIYPDQTFTQVQYNALGKQSDTYDQLQHHTHYDYDTDGRLQKTTYTDGTFEQTGYDNSGNHTSFLDRAGHTTTYDYDALNRLTKTHFADGSFTETIYSPDGTAKTSYDARHNATNYGYDDAGRRTSLTDAKNKITTFGYDNVGNQTSVLDAKQNLTQYVYDRLGRKTQTIYPGQTTDSTHYDSLGRVDSKTDQAGKVTAYGYDGDGRLTSVTQDAVQGGLNLVTTYGYDEVGNRTSQTDANQHTTKYEYDQLGRRMKRTLPAGQFETYTYDAAGNLQTKTDFRQRMVTYAYDSSNRLLSKTPDVSFPPVTFTYFPNGLRKTMTDRAGTTNYTYDNRNHLQTRQTPFGTLSYTYDPAGNLLTINSSNAGGISDTYTYDALNRLSTVTDASGQTTYGYDDVGNLQGYTYPNGVTTSYSYDQLNHLKQVGSQAQSSAIANYTYTLGPAGNRLTVAELSGRNVVYGHDSLYRLTSETVSADAHNKNGAISYTYDNVGNRLTLNSTLPPAGGMMYSYDADDRLSTEQYDANGNTTFANGVFNGYDFENRLIGQNGTSVIYDGDGNRVSETVGNVTTNYLVDIQNPTGYAQVVDELQNGVVVRTYSYGLERISETQFVNSTLTTSFYGYDGHGSARFLTNSTGVVTDTYDYDAFGNLINSTGSTPNNYLFAGEHYDPALGVYYNRARYLDTKTGRFWNMDTDQGDFHSPISLHKYLYASGNPVTNVDPTGKASLGELEAEQLDAEAIDEAADSEDYLALRELENLTSPGSEVVSGVSTVAKIATWTLAGLVLATAASAPYFGASSDGVLTNYHDPDNVALYAFGNNQAEKDSNGALYSGPREPRIGGYNRPAGDANNDLEADPTGMLEPNSPQPWPSGASTWDFPTSAPLTGPFWGTRKEYVDATYGLSLKVDGADVGGPQPAGHRTVYPSVAMTPKEFVTKWFGLGWVKAGTKK